MPINVLVTGGSGFLGGGIVRALLAKHPTWAITILDILPPPPDVEKRIAGWLAADVTSSDSVSRAFADYQPDLVMHTAGIVPARDFRYSTDGAQWERVKAINYTGTVNVLNSTMASGCRRFVFTSSVTTIIDDLNHDYHNMKEDEIKLGMATLHYGKSKAMAEQYVLSPDHAEQGLKACALRPCTIIGPGDTAVMSIMHDLIAKHETYFVIGDGNNLYDFLYVDNAIQAHTLAIENLLTTQTAAGNAFFITNQEPVYFWDFFAAVWAQFDHVPRFRVFIPIWLAGIVALLMGIVTKVTGADSTINPGSVKESFRTHYADHSKARNILGYRPEIPLSEGVRRACDAYKQHLATQAADNMLEVRKIK